MDYIDPIIHWLWECVFACFPKIIQKKQEASMSCYMLTSSFVVNKCNVSHQYNLKKTRKGTKQLSRKIVLWFTEYGSMKDRNLMFYMTITLNSFFFNFVY